MRADASKAKPNRATRAAKSPPSRSEYDDTAAVTALVAGMNHPLQATIEAVRQTILSADTAITEGIKWNSPSFYCRGWFATISYRKPGQLDIILHQGAKTRAESAVSAAIEDADQLLTWPSRDRAVLSFLNEADFRAKRTAFQRIIRQWASFQVEHAPAA